jgi:hypothetical protein
MSSYNYTSIYFPKKSFSLGKFITTQVEPVLLSLLFLVGILGSIYVFGQPFENNRNNLLQNNAAGPTSLASIFVADSEDDGASNAFNEYVSLNTAIKAGEIFKFDFLKDEKASRYVLEMGDGARLIVTQKNLSYDYAKPGKYVIELKEIKNGVLHLLGTKKIKVK